MERKIKIFSFAAILMLAALIVGCKHNVNNNRPETFSVTFGVEGENGSLKAKADGITETDKSPITVEKDKTVTFTAVPTAGYRVKGWTLDGVAVNGANTSYALKVSKSVNVKVSFEKLPPGSFAVTFGVDGTGGTLKAKVEGGSEINSGNTVEHGKIVTFTAGPSDNYEVDKWTITGGAFETGTGIGGSTTAKVKITATVNITVSFKLKNYTVTFSVDGAGGTLKATADGVAETETSPITVEHGKIVTFTATVTAAEHYVDEWTIKGGSFKAGGKDGDTTATVQITGETEVKVTFSRYKSVAFGTNGADLAEYLNTGTAASDGIYYIKVTGLQAEHLKGNLDMHESSPLAKILQAHPAKKVALKFGKLPAVTDINSCFKDCKNLVSAAAIPKGVTNLRDCFCNCEGLTQAPEIPESVTNMESCFNGCKNLTQISPFPANAKVTNMNSCFYECESLTQVPALPASVTDITNCFGKCKNLTQAPEIPASVTEMTSCFKNCIKLTKAPSAIPKGVTNLHSCFSYCSKLTKAPVIPKSVTYMKYCFKFCGELTEVTLECNYGGEGPFKEAFFFCDKLTAGTIKVPAGQLSAYQAGADDMGTTADRFYE